MTITDAIQVLTDCAARWGENTEEMFSRRIEARDTDDTLRTLCPDEGDYETAVEVRNLWRAIELVQANFQKPVEGAPR